MVLVHVPTDDALPHQRPGGGLSGDHVLQTQTTKQRANTSSRPQDTDSFQDCQLERECEGYGYSSSKCLRFVTISGITKLICKIHLSNRYYILLFLLFKAE